MQLKTRLIKAFMAAHMGIIRLSKGKIGTQLGSVSVLVLHTTGRKTAQDRAIPIAYHRLDGKIAIVASNWGRKSNPHWYLNLQEKPQALLEIKGKTVHMTASEIQGAEYENFWEIAVKDFSPYISYQHQTNRQIPIMVFTPLNENFQKDI